MPVSRLTFALTLLLLALSACRTSELDTPRRATKTAESIAEPTRTATPFLDTAPSEGAGSELAPSDEQDNEESEQQKALIIWMNAASRPELEIVDEIIRDFTFESGIHVDLVQASSDSLPELVNTAIVSGTVPDLIFHPIEFSHGWLERGILDSEAATDILETLGRETFDDSALNFLDVGSGTGSIAALPVDLERELIIYRSDWFVSNGLEEPSNYQSMIAAAEAISDPENNVYGIVVPTDSSLSATQRVFEFFALAEGCELIDSKGEVTFLHPTCLEALEYYRRLVNDFSPVGVQTEISVLNAYLAGRAAMITAPTSVLPIIAGMEPALVPSCLECTDAAFLSENSEFILELEGSGELRRKTGSGVINVLGITRDADMDAAGIFTEYWFNQGYPKWLSVEPERKIPLRSGVPDALQKYREIWLDMPMRPDMPALKEVFGPDLAEQLLRGAADIDRWGLAAGQGPIITAMYEAPLLSGLLQEMLSGYLTSSQAIIEIYRSIIDLIPDYEFEVQIAPPETPTP